MISNYADHHDFFPSTINKLIQFSSKNSSHLLIGLRYLKIILFVLEKSKYKDKLSFCQKRVTWKLTLPYVK